jgi:hypothetical protein
VGEAVGAWIAIPATLTAAERMGNKYGRAPMVRLMRRPSVQQLVRTMSAVALAESMSMPLDD